MRVRTRRIIGAIILWLIIHIGIFGVWDVNAVTKAMVSLPITVIIVFYLLWAAPADLLREKYRHNR